MSLRQRPLGACVGRVSFQQYSPVVLLFFFLYACMRIPFSLQGPGPQP